MEQQANTSAPDSVLVVGASAAGLATAESLRRMGFDGRLSILGAEARPPYDRPPLSKQVLAGRWTPEQTELRPAAALAALDAEFFLGEPASGLDIRTRTVHTGSGRTLRAEGVVIATGVRPRTLPGAGALAGVHVLRTLDDALALRAELLASTRLVVVGEGVLGCEIAATASTSGLHVTVVGPCAAPMINQLGPMIADRLAALHTAHGVRLRLGIGVTGLTGDDGRVTGVTLHDGTHLPADAVVVAIGATPATEWLTDSGLRLDNGVVCDAYCRAAEGIYAVGDVARWRHDGLGALIRLENRTNATEQAGAVAANLLGEQRPYTPVPYFWTDQFDVKIQVHGTVSTDAEIDIADGDPEAGRFVARYRTDGRVTGVVGWNMPKQSRLRRQEIATAEPSSR